MGLSKETCRLENDSDSVVKVGCATLAIRWRVSRCGPLTRHVCFVHFLRVSLDVFEVARGLSDFEIVHESCDCRD